MTHAISTRLVLGIAIIVIAACRSEPLVVSELQQEPSKVFLNLMPPGTAFADPIPEGAANKVRVRTSLGDISVSWNAKGFPHRIETGHADGTWVLFFQTERETETGEEDLFLDLEGNIVLVIPENQNETEHPVAWDDLPEPVRNAIVRFHEERRPRLIKREHEGQVVVYEALIQAEHGVYELAILPSGQILYWEPPPSSGLPDALKHVAYDERPEPLVAWVTCSSGSCQMADGTQLSWLPDN